MLASAQSSSHAKLQGLGFHVEGLGSPPVGITGIRIPTLPRSAPFLNHNL